MGASRILTVSPPHLELTPTGTPGFQHLDLDPYKLNGSASTSIKVLEEITDGEYKDVSDEYTYGITLTDHVPAASMSPTVGAHNFYIYPTASAADPDVTSFYISDMFAYLNSYNLNWAVSTNNMEEIINSLEATFTATPIDQDAELDELRHELKTMVILPPPPPDNIETTSPLWVGPPSYTPHPKTLEDTIKESPVSDTPLIYTGDDLVITLDARTIMYKPLALNEILDHKFKSY